MNKQKLYALQLFFCRCWTRTWTRCSGLIAVHSPLRGSWGRSPGHVSPSPLSRCFDNQHWWWKHIFHLFQVGWSAEARQWEAAEVDAWVKSGERDLLEWSDKYLWVNNKCLNSWHLKLVICPSHCSICWSELWNYFFNINIGDLWTWQRCQHETFCESSWSLWALEHLWNLNTIWPTH